MGGEANYPDPDAVYDPRLLGVRDKGGSPVSGLVTDGSLFHSARSKTNFSRGYFTPPQNGTYYLAIRGGEPGEVDTGSYWAWVLDWGPDQRADTLTNGTVTVGGTATGKLSYNGDQDWFAVTLTANTEYVIDVKGNTESDRGGTLNNPAVAVFDSNGDAILGATDDNGGAGLNARLSFTPTAAATHYISVDDPRGTGTYTVSVNE